MAIGRAPQQEPIADARVSPTWMGWFNRITVALQAWRESQYLIDAQGVAIVNVPAQSSATWTSSAPGVVLGDFVVGMPITGFQNGISWNTLISTQDVIDIKLTNATAGAINVTLGTWRFLIIKQ